MREGQGEGQESDTPPLGWSIKKKLMIPSSHLYLNLIRQYNRQWENDMFWRKERKINSLRGEIINLTAALKISQHLLEDALVLANRLIKENNRLKQERQGE